MWQVCLIFCLHFKFVCKYVRLMWNHKQVLNFVFRNITQAHFGPYVWLLLSFIKLINHCWLVYIKHLRSFSLKCFFRKKFSLRIFPSGGWCRISSRAWEMWIKYKKYKEVMLLLCHTSNVKKALLESLYIHYIDKSIGSPLMNRFDYFSNFYEYKS